jgi:two-component system LytT family response regulator
MEKKIKTLILEKDESKMKLIKDIIDEFFPEIEIISEAKNSEQLIDFLLQIKPDLFLMDVLSNEKENTLDILAEFKNLDNEIIIMSSDEFFAIRAINQYRVSGFMVKPINALELKKAIRKAIIDVQNKKIIRESTKKILSQKIIPISTFNAIDFIKVNDIIYVEADGRYTIFHLEGGIEKVVSKNLGEYEKLLPLNLFFRIHHKYVINTMKVKSIVKTEGNYCLLKNGKSLSIAKRRQEPFRRFLNI